MLGPVSLSERYRIQSDSFEDMWLVAKELVQRFDRHFSKRGVKDFKKSFSGPLPLQEYFLSVDHHFQVQTHTRCSECGPQTLNALNDYLCVLAARRCSAVPGSAVRAGGPVQSHPAPPADSIQGQNPSAPAEPGHPAGRHLQPGQMS